MIDWWPNGCLMSKQICLLQQQYDCICKSCLLEGDKNMHSKFDQHFPPPEENVPQWKTPKTCIKQLQIENEILHSIKWDKQTKFDQNFPPAEEDSYKKESPPQTRIWAALPPFDENCVMFFQRQLQCNPILNPPCQNCKWFCLKCLGTWRNILVMKYDWWECCY